MYDKTQRENYEEIKLNAVRFVCIYLNRVHVYTYVCTYMCIRISLIILYCFWTNKYIYAHKNMYKYISAFVNE